MKSLGDRCRSIRLLALDVDGVLTSGGIVYSAEEDAIAEEKCFHVRDGFALKVWQEVGKVSMILTGRESAVVAHRARELGIVHCYQGLSEKASVLEMALRELSMTWEEVAYLGDDRPDLPILRACGLGMTVADACPDVRNVAAYITRARGGEGAAREAIERILRCQGLWPTK